MLEQRVRCPICGELIAVPARPPAGRGHAFLVRLRARLDALGGHVVGWLLSGREGD